MDVLDARHSFRAQALESLLNGALDFLLRRLEVVESRAIPITESFPALAAA